MTRSRSLRAAAAAAVVATALGPSAAGAQPSGEAQLTALEARFATAFAAKNVDGLMSVSAPDVFAFDLITLRQYVGAAAYRKDWEGFLATFRGPIKVEVADGVVKTSGSVGYGQTIPQVSGVGVDGGRNDLVVRVTDVYRKTGGRWQRVQEHVSVPLARKSMKPDWSSRLKQG